MDAVVSAFQGINPVLQATLAGLFTWTVTALGARRPRASRPRGAAPLVLSITLHNIPEGLAVGVAFAAAAVAFAAAAMIFFVVEELIPESRRHGFEDAATMGAMGGFTVMMVLDVALG